VDEVSKMDYHIVDISALGEDSVDNTPPPEVYYRPGVDVLANGVWTRLWTGNYNFLSEQEAKDFVDKSGVVGSLPINDRSWRVVTESTGGSSTSTTHGAQAILDGTLCKTKNDAAVYYISGGKKHAITSSEAFTEKGFNWNAVVTFDDPTRLNNMPTGDPIVATPKPAPPTAQPKISTKPPTSQNPAPPSYMESGNDVMSGMFPPVDINTLLIIGGIATAGILGVAYAVMRK
jgi:hypothetical protein